MSDLNWRVAAGLILVACSTLVAGGQEPCPVTEVWEDPVTATFHYEVSDCDSPEEYSYLISERRQDVGLCGANCRILVGLEADATESAVDEKGEDTRDSVLNAPPIVTVREGNEHLPLRFTIPNRDGVYLFYLVHFPKSNRPLAVALEDKEGYGYYQGRYANGGVPVAASLSSTGRVMNGHVRRRDLNEEKELLSGVGLRVRPGGVLQSGISPRFFLIVPQDALTDSEEESPTPAVPLDRERD